MTTKHEPYYVPAQSAWPIIGAISTLFLSTPGHTGAEKGDSK
ncbi:hypothetical protein [Shewanella abyssi]|nr:hypothetical protein [Shewanella abyssi]